MAENIRCFLRQISAKYPEIKSLSPNILIKDLGRKYMYQYQVPVLVAKSRKIRISGRRIHSFAAKSRNIRISGRRIHSFGENLKNIRYPNPIFYIRMVLQKHKISRNISQDMGTGSILDSRLIRAPPAVEQLPPS